MDTYRGDNGLPLTLNLYLYCGGNPINFTDPTGHWFFKRMFRKVRRAVKRTYRAVRKTVRRTVKRAVRKVKKSNTYKRVRSAVKKTGKKIKKAVKKAKKAVKKKVKKIKAAAGSAIASVKKTASSLGQKITEKMTSGIDYLKNTFSGENIKAKAKSGASLVGKALSSRYGVLTAKGLGRLAGGYSYLGVAEKTYDDYEAQKSIEETVGNTYINAMFATASVFVGAAISACVVANPVGAIGIVVAIGASVAFDGLVNMRINGKSIVSRTRDFMMR